MRILIADDSALIRSILKRLFQFEKDFVLVGEAGNGLQAVELSRDLSPDLVIMDIDMPVMDGLTATRRIMAENPLPIIIFSNHSGQDVKFKAMAGGAVDIMQKPDMGQFNEPVFYNNFLNKLRSLARAGVAHVRSGHERPGERRMKGFRLLVMGASTGGPSAVREVLSGLPSDFPLPIALVQHTETGFDLGYARWLDDGTELSVRLVEKDMSLLPGVVWVAPVDRHIKIQREPGSLRLILDRGAKILNQRPSVDVLFASAADAAGERLIGVLLTGMGRDGAKGCLAIVEKGGITLVQDKASSVIFGMPKSAIELGGASRILPLTEISRTILSLVGKAGKKGERP